MPKIISLGLVCVLLLLSCTNIFADQIILKNGDRLTGKILKKDGDNIIIQTESAGTVTVVWKAVEKIVSEEPLNVTLSDGQILKGKVDAEEAKVNIKTQTVGTVTVEKEKINFVRSAVEQAKYEEEQNRLLHPRFGDLWRGSGDVGFSLTTGNSRTRTFTAGVRAARETVRDKITVYANAISASDSTSGVTVTSAKAVWAGARYDYNINKKWFVFAAADFEYDKPQLLDLRSVFGAGFGYRAIRNEKTQLDLFGGATYNREFYANGIRRNSAEVLIGDELKHKINARMNFAQRLAIYPNLSSAGKFRSLLDASLVTGINSWLGWHITVADRFNSDPVLGAKKNDLLLSTGLRVTFGRTE